MRADRSCRISICGEPSKSLQSTVRLARPVLKHDISEADWPEPSHGVSNWQRGIRVHAGQEVKGGVRFLTSNCNTASQSRAEV